MPLDPGARLGPYEILSLLGKGGMGEVYKAHDTRLHRDVAIKTSNQQFTERFQTEARAIAALNHPNICQIYDVGPNYIVMEHVEGSSPQGPLDVDEVLRLAHQIALAIEEAHRRQITHRDLKPGNILVKADGTVKVLDFGLAKFGGSVAAVAASDDSPTLTIAATQAGMILGTAAYMAPEQARGKAVDTRADVWAFGVVLYEISTGHRPFLGEDLADTLASVVKVDPDFNRVPRRLRKLVRACLQKDPQKRLQAIGDMRLLLDDDTGPAPVPIANPSKFRWVWPAAAALFALTAGAALWALSHTPAPEFRSAKFTLAAPPDERFYNVHAALSVSPDGRYVVFTAQDKNGISLWLRPVDSLEARPLPGTSGPPNYSFWSPDSKSIAFTDSDANKLKRVEITGGAPLTLADTAGHSAPVTGLGTWSRDGVILFGGPNGLSRTSAAGGGAGLLTKVDPKQKETGHGFPQFLPDGKRFLFFVASEDPNVEGVYASSLDSPQQRTLIVHSDAKAVYVAPKGSAPGYLLWMQENNLVAQRFNADQLQREGDLVSVAEDVARNPSTPTRACFWASDDGLLVYLRSTEANARTPIVWLTRNGTPPRSAPPPAEMEFPRLSPDGSSLALTLRSADGKNLTVWDFARSIATRLTFEKVVVQAPVWSPDSKQLAYQLSGKGLYRKTISGTDQPELLVAGGSGLPLDWSHDGKFLIYRTEATTGRDIWAVPFADDGKPGKPFAVLAEPYQQTSARLSPDGKWLAYSSNESGFSELYVQSFQPPGSSGTIGKWQVSNTGGANPAWRGDGKELYYGNPDGDIMVAGVRNQGTGLQLDAPKLLLKAGMDPAALHAFDATPDGQKFIVRLAPNGSATDVRFTVVTNWQSSLK